MSQKTVHHSKRNPCGADICTSGLGKVSYGCKIEVFLTVAFEELADKGCGESVIGEARESSFSVVREPKGGGEDMDASLPVSELKMKEDCREDEGPICTLALVAAVLVVLVTLSLLFALLPLLD